MRLDDLFIKGNANSDHNVGTSTIEKRMLLTIFRMLHETLITNIQK